MNIHELFQELESQNVHVYYDVDTLKLRACLIQAPGIKSIEIPSKTVKLLKNYRSGLRRFFDSMFGVEYWLAMIGETNVDTINEIYQKCQTDSAVFDFYLGKAREVYNHETFYRTIFDMGEKRGETHVLDEREVRLAVISGVLETEMVICGAEFCAIRNGTSCGLMTIAQDGDGWSEALKMVLN